MSFSPIFSILISAATISISSSSISIDYDTSPEKREAAPYFYVSFFTYDSEQLANKYNMQYILRIIFYQTKLTLSPFFSFLSSDLIQIGIHAR